MEVCQVAHYKLYESKKIHDLREMLEESASLYAGQAAFMQKKNGKYKSYTFARFKNEVFSLGEALSLRGYAGKRVIVTGENCYLWCVSYMAVICGLGVIVPVDKDIPAEELANIAKISEASLILYSDKCEAKVSALPDEIEKISFSRLPKVIAEGSAALVDGSRTFASRSIDIDAMAALIFTSGTTGVSKGVMLSQRNICCNLYNLAKMVKITPADRALSVLPLHHVYECTCGFLYPVYCGATVAFSEGIRYIMKNVKEVRPTKIICVPLLIETMYKKIWANIRKKGIEGKVKTVIKVTNKIPNEALRKKAKKKAFAEIHDSFGGRLNMLVSGGAGIDPEVIVGMRDFGIKIIQGYGLTESAPLAAVNHDSYYNDRSAGLVLPSGELKIIDKAPDGTGEICYRGDNVMLGYYNEPKLTAETKKNGWLHTGDIGYIDRDGFLIITGRKKNVIVRYNGKNVFPEELEAYLGRHKLVGESVVIGIHSDKKNDYDIVAAIKPDEEYATELLGKGYSEKELEKRMSEIVAEVNATVQSYKRIDVFVIPEGEFPKTSTKKIKRFDVPAMIMHDYQDKIGG